MQAILTLFVLMAVVAGLGWLVTWLLPKTIPEIISKLIWAVVIIVDVVLVLKFLHVLPGGLGSLGMIFGISGAALPAGFPFKQQIENVCASPARNFPPCLVGAIKMNETGLGDDPAALEYGADPETGLLPNGDNAGHGIMQLTSSWPDPGWDNAWTNIAYAVDHFLIPALVAWKDSLQGDDLVRAIAASYNAGLGKARQGHCEGDVDKYTTNDYGARALKEYTALAAGTIPQE